MNEYLQNFSLEGKIILIIGVSYGIGFAVAGAMAGVGATIVFNDVKQELVDKDVTAYKEEGVETHDYMRGVTNEDVVGGLVSVIEKEVGVINTLVDNAGIVKRVSMHDMSAVKFRQVIGVDLNAPFIVSKVVVPGMIKKGHGRIVNICPMMSEPGHETASVYTAAKGGLKVLTKNITFKYSECDIQCDGIGPGYIVAPQTAPLHGIQPDGSRHLFSQFTIAETPTGRQGKTEDLDRPTVFLASGVSDFVNSLASYVDDGVLAYIGKQSK